MNIIHEIFRKILYIFHKYWLYRAVQGQMQHPCEARNRGLLNRFSDGFLREFFIDILDRSDYTGFA